MKIKNTKTEKKKLEGQIPRHKINKFYFKHIRSRKLAKADVGPISTMV